MSRLLRDKAREAPPASPAPVSGDRRARLAWAGALFCSFAAVYGLSHDRVYYFDGLLQGGMIDNPILGTPAQMLFEWNHFLWYPVGRFFFLALEFLRLGREGYETLQFLNTLLGGAGVSLLFLILCRWTGRPWAAAWAALAGLGQVYWYRSAGGENHLAAAVWCFAQIHFLLEYWASPRAAPLAGMAATGLLAAYFHLGHFAAWGVAGLAVLLRRPRGRVFSHAAAVTAMIGLGWLPYASVQSWFDPGGFKKWWLWATAQAHGYSVTGASKGIQWDLWGKGTLSLRTLVRSFLAHDAWTWGTTALLAALAALGGFVYLWGRRAGADRAAPAPGTVPPRVLLLPFGAFFLLYSLWMPGNYMYWIVPWAVLCLYFGAATHSVQPARPPALCWAALGLMAALLAWNNLSAVILPRKEFTVKGEVEMCRDIARLTPPESPVIISGRRQVNLKPYIPYFAKRNRLAVELYALNGQAQNTDPINWMFGIMAQSMRAGVPVYITQDALDSKNDFADFGLSPDRVESIWKGFLLFPVRDFPGPPANRLYLMWAPDIPDEAQYVLCLRLKMHGLADQLRWVYAERMKRDPSPKLAAEARRSLEDLPGRP